LRKLIVIKATKVNNDKPQTIDQGKRGDHDGVRHKSTLGRSAGHKDDQGSDRPKGRDGFIVKPFSAQSLREKVEEILLEHSHSPAAAD
jgi:hypothetical protein